MKKSVIVLAAASLGMLASCGNKATVKNGEAYGLVHGAGYVGAATVKVEGDKHRCYLNGILPPDLYHP